MLTFASRAVCCAVLTGYVVTVLVSHGDGAVCRDEVGGALLFHERQGGVYLGGGEDSHVVKAHGTQRVDDLHGNLGVVVHSVTPRAVAMARRVLHG